MASAETSAAISPVTSGIICAVSPPTGVATKANAEHVGPAFPEEARKMHYGETEAQNIYGEASPKEAKALQEERIPALPLPPLPEDQN